MKYNEHKYYRIVEIKREDKSIVYEVQAKDKKSTRWLWATVYEKKNYNLEEAISQIKHLMSLKLKSIKTVYIKKV